MYIHRGSEWSFCLEEKLRMHVQRGSPHHLLPVSYEKVAELRVSGLFWWLACPLLSLRPSKSKMHLRIGFWAPPPQNTQKTTKKRTSNRGMCFLEWWDREIHYLCWMFSSRCKGIPFSVAISLRKPSRLSKLGFRLDSFSIIWMRQKSLKFVKLTPFSFLWLKQSTQYMVGKYCYLIIYTQVPRKLNHLGCVFLPKLRWEKVSYMLEFWEVPDPWRCKDQACCCLLDFIWAFPEPKKCKTLNISNLQTAFDWFWTWTSIQRLKKPTCFFQLVATLAEEDDNKIQSSEVCPTCSYSLSDAQPAHQVHPSH